MATVTHDLSIFPAADTKDVYLLHRGLQELVATIIEWSDCVEVRVTRKLDAAEHAAAMAFVGTLAGRDCTVINYEPNAEAIAAAGGCQVAKAERPAVTPACEDEPAWLIRATADEPDTPGAVISTARPRMILLPVDHECLCDGSEDDPCHACQAIIDRADMAARDRSAAAEYGFYEGLVA